MPLDSVPLLPLMDARLSGMATNAFTLSGLEEIDGCLVCAVVVVQACIKEWIVFGRLDAGGGLTLESIGVAGWLVASQTGTWSST